jgi:hypothetical protein
MAQRHAVPRSPSRNAWPAPEVSPPVSMIWRVVSTCVIAPRIPTHPRRPRSICRVPCAMNDAMVHVEPRDSTCRGRAASLDSRPQRRKELLRPWRRRLTGIDGGLPPVLCATSDPKRPGTHSPPLPAVCDLSSGWTWTRKSSSTPRAPGRGADATPPHPPLIPGGSHGSG